MSVIDPFLGNSPIPHPLRTSENQKYNFCCCQGDIMGTSAINGLDKSISRCADAYTSLSLYPITLSLYIYICIFIYIYNYIYICVCVCVCLCVCVCKCAIMKTMWPPGYHHNGLVVAHALRDEPKCPSAWFTTRSLRW